jgi:uncharacterized protein (TIGR03083 family)
VIARTTAVELIPAIGHDEAMHLATVECARLLAVADDLRDEQWMLPTECPGWSVKDMLGHLLGMLELQSDGEERMRQFKIATGIAEQTGGRRLDAMTALQVREHASLSSDALRRALHDVVPRGLAGRSATTREERGAPYFSGLPGEDAWTFGYLFDIILTRDPWIHRVDICRAVVRDMELTSEHDGRIVADVVADWARRHRQPFTLTLGGSAGDHFTSGTGGPDLELDAVEFCRILSGRARGTGRLLATSVPF